MTAFAKGVLWMLVIIATASLINEINNYQNYIYIHRQHGKVAKAQAKIAEIIIQALMTLLISIALYSLY